MRDNQIDDFEEKVKVNTFLAFSDPQSSDFS